MQGKYDISKKVFLLTQRENQEYAVCRRGVKDCLVVDEGKDALNDASVRIGYAGRGCVELLFVRV